MKMPTLIKEPTAHAGQLLSLAEAIEKIHLGLFLSIAADEAMLRQLPAGDWIGGTIPYFMSPNGGKTTQTQVFVVELPMEATSINLMMYDEATLPTVCRNIPDNGFALMVLPGFSAIHTAFARHAPSYEDMYVKPLVGWVSGYHLGLDPVPSAWVVDGRTLTFSKTHAIVAHVTLPDYLMANIEIINVFSPGDGDVIRFHESGFSVSDCTINGQPTQLGRYVKEHNIDTRLPLVADYSGALINVCIQGVDTEQGIVNFYGPVFSDVSYRFAAPIDNYAHAFEAYLQNHRPKDVAFSCNCVLNYIYLGLEGKQVPEMSGPMTFGEIAYQLLNQTFVYLTVTTCE